MDNVSSDAIDDFVIELVNVRKFLQFYPANNTHLRSSLVQLYQSFRVLVEGEPGENPVTPDGLMLTVERNSLFWGEHLVGRGFGPVARLATDLYRVQVKQVQILPTATRVDLQLFLDATCMKPAAVREEGGFEKVLNDSGVRGVRVSFPDHVTFKTDSEPIEAPEPANGAIPGVDMVGYLRSAQALRQPEDKEEPGYGPETEETADINEISDFFTDIMSGSEEKMSYFMVTLSDPVRLKKALEHIHQVESARIETDVGRSLRVLRKSFSQILKNVRGFSAELREEFIRNIGMAILSTPPEVQESLVQEGLAAEVGKSDVADSVLSVMPDADIAEALLNAVRFHDGTSSTISNFMNEFAGDPRRRVSIIELMTRLSADDESEAVSHVIELLRTGLESHGDAPLPAEYARGSLGIDHEERRSLSRLMTLEAQEIDQIEETVETDFHLRTPHHAARALLELYVQPTIEGVSERTSERLTQQLLEILDDGGYEYLAEIVRMVETELPITAQSRVRPQLEAVMRECAYPEHLNRIFSKMRKVGRVSDEYGQLRYLIDVLGERAFDHLFLRLEMEHSRSMRMFFLDLFRELGDKTLPLLDRKMRHRDWFVVRNVVYILGSLGTETAIHSLVELLGHEDMRVRREVVRALAKTGGAAAEDALMRMLDDAEPAMRRIAAQWLGFMGCVRALPELRRRLSVAREGSADIETLIGLVRGIGRLGTGADAGLIREVVPRVTFFGGEKKRELIRAGKEALERLESTGAGVGV